MNQDQDYEDDAAEAIAAFEREVGVSNVPNSKVSAGPREFLKFGVGREAPLYTYALLAAQKNLRPDNVFKGALALAPEKAANFPASIEASALQTLLTRSTREQAQGTSAHGFSIPYAPFQKREDHLLAQPANHIVRGRRGVGKSTLIRRATELLADTRALVCILDMQTYSTLEGDDLVREVYFDMCIGIASSATRRSGRSNADVDALRALANDIASGATSIARAPVLAKRILSSVTHGFSTDAFVFLDDFHLVAREAQPKLLHSIHAALKGSNGWIKVAGLSSLLNVYAPNEREGLQIPGDAQYVELDLTLENPEAAEAHLQVILEGFLTAVGYSLTGTVLPDAAFRRLAWANAGVPRDFLQMFGRSLQHAARNRHATVTLSDVNVAIGEFGQQKMDDLQKDARYVAGKLRAMLGKLETLCLDREKINAFLIRGDDTPERAVVQILSDLRMVHLIHQSITPRKAGERFEAYILDYSLFTGFRRRPNVKEMIPKHFQFKASELRALPKVPDGYFADELADQNISNDLLQ
ncbi:hypothetical protein F4827_002979 [Paraburkholderia bannensis]|uniref:Uncharacterized protein n=1 Tax=Paraburkholderia bannensis TaxID=765414 RepID=A0A7W9WT25_9BURK|nr:MULTISPECIES: ATP-binding protein [Paraburkholderia]MBB3258111.1 hypothetical protein [Paraburkholderia sp. WP4_3_2]MBB6103124.1 hypothetical protein [Paraburkholderia bannensis]